MRRKAFVTANLSCLVLSISLFSIRALANLACRVALGTWRDGTV